MIDVINRILKALWTEHVSTTYLPTTREAALQEAGGIGLDRESITLGDGVTVGTQVVNLFKFTGCVQLKDLLMIVTAVGDATTFGSVKFEVIADGAVVDLTTGVAGAATVVGSKFIKMANKTTALVHLKADDVKVEESAFNRLFVEAAINAKPAVDNYIRVSFTGDAATDITVTASCRWAPICGGTVTTP